MWQFEIQLKEHSRGGGSEQSRAKGRQVVRKANELLPHVFRGELHLRLLLLPEVVHALLADMRRRELKPGTISPIMLPFTVALSPASLSSSASCPSSV